MIDMHPDTSLHIARLRHAELTSMVDHLLRRPLAVQSGVRSTRELASEFRVLVRTSGAHLHLRRVDGRSRDGALDPAVPAFLRRRRCRCAASSATSSCSTSSTTSRSSARRSPDRRPTRSPPTTAPPSSLVIKENLGIVLYFFLPIPTNRCGLTVPGNRHRAVRRPAPGRRRPRSSRGRTSCSVADSGRPSAAGVQPADRPIGSTGQCHRRSPCDAASARRDAPAVGAIGVQHAGVRTPDTRMGRCKRHRLVRSGVMGQLVAVTEKPSSSPGVVRFELNRALTGMGHEHFRSAEEAFGPRPAAELARRLFATGQADGRPRVLQHRDRRPGQGIVVGRAGRRRALPLPVLAAGDVASDVRGPPTCRGRPRPGRRRRAQTVRLVATRRWPKRPSGCRCTCSSAAVPPASAGRRSRDSCRVRAGRVSRRMRRDRRPEGRPARIAPRTSPLAQSNVRS